MDSFSMSVLNNLPWFWLVVTVVCIIIEGISMGTLTSIWFGCGAFINDPETVAKAYKIALQEFSGVFKHVEFAIKSGEEKTRNYRAFEKVFC